MPYRIEKKPHHKFAVWNIDKKIYKSKGTTLPKAKAQVRLLEYVDAKRHQMPFSR